MWTAIARQLAQQQACYWEVRKSLGKLQENLEHS